MSGQNYKIVSGITLFVVLLIIGFILLFRSEDTPQTSDEISLPPHAENTPQRIQHTVGIEELFQPIVQQVEPVVSYYTDIFSIKTTNENDKNAAKSVNPAKTVQAPAQTPVPRPSRSSDPLFSTIWPDFYIDYLTAMQALLVDVGIYDETRYKFETDAEIFEFLGDFLEYAHTESIITEGEYKNIKHGLEIDLPQSQTIELQLLQKQTSAQHVFQQILTLLTITTARAQPIPTPSIPGVNDCFKDFIPSFPVPGINLWAPCCNCCIPTTFGCIPIGCLNAVCAVWPNAIYDPLTGICGCG